MFIITREEVEKIKEKHLGTSCKNVCEGSGAIFNPIQKSFETCKCAQLALREIKMLNAGIPKRYWEFSIDDLLEKVVQKNERSLKILKRYVDKIKDMVEGGYGLFIQGKSGLAKSAIAHYILREALDKGIVVYSLRMSQLTKLIFESLSDSYKKEMLEWIRDEVELLLIDEIEKDYRIDNTSTFSGSQVNEFFGDIYDKKKSLIITSNKSKADLKGAQAENVIDRLNELIDVILIGESFRKQDEALVKLIK